MSVSQTYLQKAISYTSASTLDSSPLLFRARQCLSDECLHVFAHHAHSLPTNLRILVLEALIQQPSQQFRGNGRRRIILHYSSGYGANCRRDSVSWRARCCFLLLSGSVVIVINIRRS